MNCEFVNNKIEALTLADFANGLDAELKAHIVNCAGCEQALKIQHAYLTQMSEVTTPDLNPSVAAVMLRNVTERAVEQKSTKAGNGFLQGFVAASVLALSVFGTWNIYQSYEQAPLVAEAVQESFTTEVVLVINAQEDMYDADLNIILPEEIALEGYDNMQELSWPVDLKAGANTLSLPIRVNKHQAIEQPLSIMAKLYHYAEEREFEIKVDVEKMQAKDKNSAYLMHKQVNSNTPSVS